MVNAIIEFDFKKFKLILAGIYAGDHVARFSILNINCRAWEGSLFGIFHNPGIFAIDLFYFSVMIYINDMGKLKIRVM